jgi:hypothetical protein
MRVDWKSVKGDGWIPGIFLSKLAACIRDGGNKTMKTKTLVWTVGIFALALVATFGLVLKLGQPALTTTGQTIDEETGEVIGPWANALVSYKVLTADAFDGSNVASTIKVYDEQPEDWGNPRGDFTDAAAYTVYTASSGVVTINREKPGTYFCVATASGYNTEFYKITIPDGTGRGDLSDYQTSPDSEAQDMSLVGSTTDKDFAFTLVNDTSAEISDTVLLTVADGTEFRAWKVIVNDQEGFSTDTDGDGTYDEGVSRYKVCVQDVCETIFDPDRSVDLFDSNNEYTMNIEGVSVADGKKVAIDVEVDAITEDGTALAANDELWSEGEGVLSYIKVYDMQGNLFATSDVTA